MKNDKKNKSDHFSGIASPKLLKTRKPDKNHEKKFCFSLSSDVVCHFSTNVMEIINFWV